MSDRDYGVGGGSYAQKMWTAFFQDSRGDLRISNTRNRLTFVVGWCSGNNLFSFIRWCGVAARCVRLTTSLRSASSKFAFPSCYLKVFSDFSLYIHQFWLVRQNNADIRVFHPSDLAVHFEKILQVINWI
jgi:hypothetical protein